MIYFGNITAFITGFGILVTINSVIITLNSHTPDHLFFFKYQIDSVNLILIGNILYQISNYKF
jgi:hypothetical protein